MKIEIKINETDRRADGLASVNIEVPALALSYNLHLPFDDLFERCGTPDDLNLDLLLTASLCYVADKLIPRREFYDAWTRTLEIEFSIKDVKLWRGISDSLTKALNFLTGDDWQISFKQRKEKLFQAPTPKKRRKPLPPSPKNIDAVCSFSGGLDSLIGAIELLEDSKIKGLRLVGHYDAPGAKKPQSELFEIVSRNYPGKSELFQVRVSHKPVKANESTLRSRSFVFIAIGLFIARASNDKIPFYMPENGFIALNVPLTPSRVGACSTRTMHPYFLDKIQEVIKGLGIENSIINPLELKTKGEAVEDCSNLILLRSIADLSVSCSHGMRKQLWVRRKSEYKNCGYCFPCLIRRAALHKVNFDNPGMYGIDVCRGEMFQTDQTDSSNDLRAVISALRSNKTFKDFRKDIMSVASVNRMEERSKMIERGFREIKSLLQEKSTEDVLQNMGLTKSRK